MDIQRTFVSQCIPACFGAKTNTNTRNLAILRLAIERCLQETAQKIEVRWVEPHEKSHGKPQALVFLLLGGGWEGLGVLPATICDLLPCVAVRFLSFLRILCSSEGSAWHMTITKTSVASVSLPKTPRSFVKFCVNRIWNM